METGVMSLKKFEELDAVHGPRCVSIYMPTHRYGKENYEEDRIRFKDHLKAIKKELLEQFGMSESEADNYLSPAHELEKNNMFWHYTGKGLAFFLSEEGARVFRLPIEFGSFHHISDKFYLHPLFPFFNGDGRFYVIGISEKAVKLWEASRYQIREVSLPEDLPRRMEDVVGYDHEEKTLQERSFKGGGSQKIMHGHGEGRDEETMEHEKFFRRVDEQLSRILDDEHVPLVFAGVEHYYGLYRKIAHYRQLETDGYVKGSLEELELDEVHAKAWEIVKDRFDEDRDHYIQQYKDNMGGERAVYDNADIVKAALDARVEALFIEKGTHLYGLYDAGERKVHFAAEKTSDNEDLVELAAMNTHRKDGRVFLLEREQMPELGTQMNALLRY